MYRQWKEKSSTEVVCKKLSIFLWKKNAITARKLEIYYNKLVVKLENNLRKKSKKLAWQLTRNSRYWNLLSSYEVNYVINKCKIQPTVVGSYDLACTALKNKKIFTFSIKNCKFDT